MLPKAFLRTACVTLASGAVLLGACQSQKPAGGHGSYRVVWTAFRTSDNASLGSYNSPTFGLDGSVDVRTNSLRPEENRPAFPRFTARLSPNRLRPSTLELVTRAFVKEVIRTRKGKLKTQRRVIGGLLPIRIGETQTFSGPGDPIRLDAHLEGGGTGVQGSK